MSRHCHCQCHCHYHCHHNSRGFLERGVPSRHHDSAGAAAALSAPELGARQPPVCSTHTAAHPWQHEKQQGLKEHEQSAQGRVAPARVGLPSPSPAPALHPLALRFSRFLLTLFSITCSCLAFPPFPLSSSSLSRSSLPCISLHFIPQDWHTEAVPYLRAAPQRALPACNCHKHKLSPHAFPPPQRPGPVLSHEGG